MSEPILKAPQNKENGAPPPNVEDQLEALYAGLPAPEAAEEEVPAPAAFVAPPCPYPSPPALEHNEKDVRLLRRLRDSKSQLEVKVNGVDLIFDVVDVSKTEDSVCCLIKPGVTCRLPKTQDVVIKLDGEILPAVFLGAWHTVEWLGVHVVIFPLLPRATESEA